MKLITRAALGWPASAAPRQATTKGVKVHYEGTAVSTRLLTDHDACLQQWKDIRASHLANKAENYSDVAYNYAACPHGYLLEGRGIGRRTGANGNQPLNIAHYAIVGLVGSEGLTQPTDAMLSAIRDGIDLLRKNGAGTEIKGHRDGYATACPGGPLYAWVQKGAPRPATAPAPTPPKEDPLPTPADLWNADIVPAAAPPYGNSDYAKNKKWTASYALGSAVLTGRRTEAKIDALTKQFAAQSAAIKTLAGLVGKGVDTAAVVAAVEAAATKAVERTIQDAVIDVNINTTPEG